MAVDQPKPADAAQDGPAGVASETAKPGTPTAKPGTPTAKPGTPANSELDDLKRRFREALDRKRGSHAAANAEGAQDTGKVHGSHGPAASRRSFRRKSGG